MKSKDRYDLIAVGDQTGALLSAVMAARAGFSVLIVPQPLGVPARAIPVSQGEQVFDLETNAVGGVFTPERYRAPVEDILKRSGILDSEWQAVQGDRRGVELVMESGRVRLGEGHRTFLNELKREWGGETREWAGVQSLMRATEEMCLSHWGRAAQRLSVRRNVEDKKSAEATEYSYRNWNRSLKRAVQTKKKAQPLGNVAQPFQSVLDALAESQSSHPGVNDLYQTLALLEMEAPFRGGMTAWRAQLLRLAKRLGAEVAPKAEFKHIWVSRGRFLGVQLGAKSAVIEGRAGVLGVPLSLTRQRIVQSGFANWRSLKAPLEPCGWKFSIALTVHQEALPQGLPSRTVISEKGAPALEVETASPEDYGVNDPEYRVIFLRTVLPFDSETLRPEYQRMMAARMVRKLTELFPFVEYHVVHLYPDFRILAGQRRKLGVLATEETTHEAENGAFPVYGEFQRLEEIPDQLRVYRGPGRGVQSGIGHLFLVGSESYPELGAWGSAWAAIEATQWLAQKSGMSSILQNEKKGEES